MRPCTHAPIHPSTYTCLYPVYLALRGRVGHYPLFARIHEIAFRGKPPQSIVALPDAALPSRL